ncbi:MAG: hypothetical protein WC560_09325 [Syntrophales bacterium]
MRGKRITVNEDHSITLSPLIFAAMIFVLFLWLGSLIGLMSAIYENDDIKTELQKVRMKIEQKNQELATFRQDYQTKESEALEDKNSSEVNLAILQNVISKFHNTTLVNRYNSTEGWSGFESLPCRGEQSLQCAVDRFFMEWNDNIDLMKSAGCKNIEKKLTGIHHNKCCD